MKLVDNQVKIVFRPFMDSPEPLRPPERLDCATLFSLGLACALSSRNIRGWSTKLYNVTRVVVIPSWKSVWRKVPQRWAFAKSWRSTEHCT